MLIHKLQLGAGFIKQTTCTEKDTWVLDINRIKISELETLTPHDSIPCLYNETYTIFFMQVLQSASEEYRCLDTFKGSQNNILYIFCHNPMSPNRWCKEFWDVALHTDVKFRSECML